MNYLIFFGSCIVLVLIIVAIFAPLIAPYDPTAINIQEALLPPSRHHILGTDSLGRDLLSRIIYGARISLSVGLIAVGIATVVGIIFGSIAGYYGGVVDSVIMRVVDIMLCFPAFFLILACVSLLGPNIFNIMAIIGLTGWMGVARLVRAEFLTLKEREWVLALRAMGASDFRIILKHLIPNATGPILVSATLGIAGAILTESALSFLGIGIQPPTPSWGNILTEARATLDIAWWLMLFPGLIILITVLGCNLLGEGLREKIY